MTIIFHDTWMAVKLETAVVMSGVISSVVGCNTNQ